MTTLPRDRLSQFFVGEAVPSTPDPRQSQLAGAETEGKMDCHPNPWTIPDAPQYPREIPKEPSRTSGRDILTSSEDEDDYVAAFAQKPKMKPPNGGHSLPPNSAIIHGPSTSRNPGEEHINSKDLSRPPHYGKDIKDALVSAPLPTNDGRGNPARGHFCLLQLVSKFPYKYMDDSGGRVSRHFFANGKFYNRLWDVYYLYPPSHLHQKPLLLLSLPQVQELVNEIGAAFNIPVHVPQSPFTISFFADGTPQPKLLGASRSREDINRMEEELGGPHSGYGEAPPGASPEVCASFTAFRSKCQKAVIANKKKTHTNKRGKSGCYLTLEECGFQLERAQQYFGLRPLVMEPDTPPLDMSWEQQEASRKIQQEVSKLMLRHWDPSDPVPHPFHKEPVIISIDIESYERAHHLITEIGISTLDTLDLAGIPPGEGGDAWMKYIRSRHFRIRDHQHLINKDFCIGNPDGFQFGKSEFVGLDEAHKIVDSCFEWPFSVHFKHAGRAQTQYSGWKTMSASNPDIGRGNKFDGINIGPTNEEQNAANLAAVARILEVEISTLAAKDPGIPQKGPRTRNLLLLGHNPSADLSYLQTLGSSIFTASSQVGLPSDPLAKSTSTAGAEIRASIHEVLDTAAVDRALRQDPQSRSLGSVLVSLDHWGMSLHNGGNDARYTLEALIGLVLKASVQKDQADANSKFGKGLESEVGVAKSNEGEENADAWKQPRPSQLDGTTDVPPQPRGIGSRSARSRPVAGIDQPVDRSKGTFASALPVWPSLITQKEERETMLKQKVVEKVSDGRP